MLNPTNLEKGKEQNEEYMDSVSKRTMVQYDYRSENNELFSCVKETLEECQKAMNEWLKMKTRQEMEEKLWS